MSGHRHSVSVFSAGLLGLGLALAWASPASAGGRVIDCVLGSKESPERLISACSTIVDNAASRSERSAALVVRADAERGPRAA